MFIYCNTQEIKRIQALQFDIVYMEIWNVYTPPRNVE